MSRKIALCGAAAATVAASLLTSPAYAADEFSITVAPTAAKPSESITVTGTADDPVCAEDGVAVSLHYTKPDGTLAAATVNTTTDAAGAFSAEITVPDIAFAGEKAYVNAVIADCTPPEEASVGARSSQSVDFDVVPYEGKLTLGTKKGKPGQKLSFAGTECWGGEAVFVFGDEVLEGEPEEDKTFEGSFTLPDLPSGTYPVTAQCPGTDYAVLSFTLVNPAAAPPVAPPARPIPRRPTFTG
jgi:hypothetical protein